MHAEYFRIFFPTARQTGKSLKFSTIQAFARFRDMAVEAFKELFGNFAQSGIVEFISIRPKRLEDVRTLDVVQAVPDDGLEGDRYRNAGGSRQVTLIQAEHLQAMASYLGKESVDPKLTRRNIVVKGINLLALKGQRFQIGQAILEYSGECHPCSRMEENFGPGGYNAMRGHGGITAKVIRGGEIRVGDTVSVLAKKDTETRD
jgi:MOSC domain-containing protein YiiM